VGKSGVLQSKLKARKLVIAGKFHGEAECEAIELLGGGVVEGTLCTSSLAVDKDASFEGSSIRKKLDAAPSVLDMTAKQKAPANEKSAPGLAS